MALLLKFKEEQIYRIDHYLGKETVQNLMVTRFSNSIFEPLWNRNYIQRIEITAAESVGVGDRGGYYEGAGALRDMIQNHLLQLLSLVAMEPPNQMTSEAIRNEKDKLFQSLRPLSTEDVKNNVIRGQYTSANVRDKQILGYREENSVHPTSRTETFAAMKFFIDNWRWADVPFYIRSGKRLPTRVSEVVIHFKSNHLHLFKNEGSDHAHNILIFRIQPNEGILLKFGLKVPGAGNLVKDVNMDFQYDDLTQNYVPDAYERLILDCMQGDSTLYARGDSVKNSWKFIDPILKAWKDDPDIPIYGYPAGTWGPEHINELIEGKDVAWRNASSNLSHDGEYCEL
jgi:glucose-6-phosphate 1-dehydrogenase